MARSQNQIRIRFKKRSFLFEIHTGPNSSDCRLAVHIVELSVATGTHDGNIGTVSHRNRTVGRFMMHAPLGVSVELHLFSESTGTPFLNNEEGLCPKD